MPKRFSDYTTLSSLLDQVNEHTRYEQQTETIPYDDGFGRVLAQDITSPVNVPSISKSRMDGYAVKSTDSSKASRLEPVSLHLAGSVPLGTHTRPRLSTGQAIRVPTGGFLPRGADAVVMVEKAEIQGDDVILREQVLKGQHVHARGEDITRGELLYHRGHEIRAQDLDVLGTDQIYEVEVFRPPTVAVLAVGSEIRDDPTELGPGNVLNTHSKLITVICGAAGCETIDLGMAVDDVEDIKDKISSGLDRADIVMTIGGSSVGEADLVSQAIDSLGSPGVVVHGVKLDLGRVAGCGVVRGKPIVILPGLIGSTLNAFIAIGLPLIRRMAGFRREDSFEVEARLTKDRVFREKYGDFLKISYVRLSQEAGEFMAKPLEAEATDVGIFTEANGFFTASEDTLRVNEGESVLVEFLPGFSFPKSWFFPDMPCLD